MWYAPGQRGGAGVHVLWAEQRYKHAGVATGQPIPSRANSTSRTGDRSVAPSTHATAES
jgi:hypothetical protein